MCRWRFRELGERVSGMLDTEELPAILGWLNDSSATVQLRGVGDDAGSTHAKSIDRMRKCNG